jgi:hypothetical protein
MGFESQSHVSEVKVMIKVISLRLGRFAHSAEAEAPAHWVVVPAY